MSYRDSYDSHDIAHIASSVILSLILKSSHFSISLASGILIYAAFLSCLTLFPQQWKVIIKPRAQHKRQHSARVKKPNTHQNTPPEKQPEPLFVLDML